jgi:predicted ATPase
MIWQVNIEKYRNLRRLRVKGLAQINLIGGKNRIGKSAFLEAVFLVGEKKRSKRDLELRLQTIFRSRGGCLQTKTPIAFFDYMTDRLQRIGDVKIESPVFAFSLEVFKPISDRFFLLEDESSENFLVPNCALTPVLQKQLFPLLQKSPSLYRKFLDALSQFDPDLSMVENRKGELFVYSESAGGWFPITELGSGVQNWITLMVVLLTNKKRPLFLDRVDEGLHHSQLATLWRLLFHYSQENQLQIFATTHNRECVEAFNKVQFERKEIGSKYLEMYRERRGKWVKIRQLDLEQLQYRLENFRSFRGE